MKRLYIILGIVFIILIGVAVGLALNNKPNISEENNIIIAKSKDVKPKNDTVETAMSENKTTPNTLFIYKKYYKKCDHLIKQECEIPDNCVNLTEEELKQMYKDWQIEYFSRDQVILYKEEPGICDEHYIIRNCEGYIYIYVLDDKDNEKLLAPTEIAVTYLPEADQIELEKGIKIIGKEKLNSVLEDYE